MTSDDVGVDVDDVRAAALAIHGQVVRTTAAPSRVLSSLTGSEVVLKYETQQFTGSYKERGALTRLLQLTDEERLRGVVAASAGNHAQGVAHHATRLGIKSTIVMPLGTPFVKVARTQALGATVELTGRNLDEAMVRALEIATGGAVFVHPFDDPHVIAGQGTVGLELVDDALDLDALLVPVGGGGLLAGVATAFRGCGQKTEIIGVQSQRYPGMWLALRDDSTAVPGGATLAEGIAVSHPGLLTRQLARRVVDDVVLVTEESLEDAVNAIIEVERIVVEGAGAAGVAALLADPARYRGRRVGIILTGSNIDQRVLAEVILRGLTRSGRTSTLRVLLDDSPGRLASLLTVVADQRANLLDVTHHRSSGETPAREVLVSLSVETLDRAHLEQLVAALTTAGARLR